MIINLTDFNFLGKNIFNVLNSTNLQNHVVHELPIKLNGIDKSLCFFLKEKNEVVNNIKDDDIIEVEADVITSELQDVISDRDNKISDLEIRVMAYREVLSSILNTGEVSDEHIEKLVDIGMLEKTFITNYK